MSNAMRMGKRTLAGVAAGALALGALSIAGASSASAGKAKPQVTPSTSAASVGPVRYSTTASTQDPVKGAPFLFSAVGTDDTKVQTDDTVVLKLLVAPSNASQLYFSKAQATFPGAAAVDDTLSLTSSSSTKFISSSAFAVQGTTGTDDTVLSTHVAVNEGGTYSGTIKIYDGNRAAADDTGLLQTTTFSFTTAGKPTSLVLDPTSLALVASTLDSGDVTGSVKDSAGNLTQIGATDSLTVVSGTTAVATVDPAAWDANSFDDSTATVLGTAKFTATATATAGSSTVTVTPLGTLPGSGVTAQTVTVTTTAGGTTAPTALTMTAPTGATVIDDTNTDDTKGYFINGNLVTGFTVTGTGASANAGQTAVVTFSGGTSVKVNGTAVTSGDSVLTTSDASGNVTFIVSGTVLPTQFTIQTGTSTKSKWVVVNKITPTFDPSISPAGAIIKKTGEATDIVVTLTDDFGNPYIGYFVTGKATATAGSPAGASSAAGVTNASGVATISVPAPSTTYNGGASVAFTIKNPGGDTNTTLTNAMPTLSVTYSASGAVTSVSVAQAETVPNPVLNTTTSITQYPYMVVPYDGVVNTGSPGTYTPATAAGTAAGEYATFTPTATPANSVTVTVPEGVKVSKTTGVLWSAGSTSLTVASGTPVYVFATKTGEHDVTFTSGDVTTTAKIKVATSNQAAYNILVSPESQTLSTGAIGTAVVTITDVFGNPVPSTTDDSGGVTASATGEILLSGYSATQKLTTNTSGQATITILAGGSAGDGSIAIVPTAKNNAWASTYTPPTGAPAPVTSAAAVVKVTSAPTAKTIVIEGERGTVKGKPGIMVDGITTGFAEGDKVVPWIKFPGQTEYTAGSARPEIDAEGEFSWKRKTGKKIYIYFKNEDGTVKSDRIIIQAK